jgi:hypothetical protein
MCFEQKEAKETKKRGGVVSDLPSPITHLPSPILSAPGLVEVAGFVISRA